MSATPAIRFDGFTDPWEQRKLGDLCEINSGRDYKQLGEGAIPVYGTGGYMLSVDEALSYDRDAVGIGRKGTIDKPYKLRAPFWTVDTLFYCLPESAVDLGFLEGLFLNVDWASKDESTGLPSLSKTIISDVDVLVPDTDEQVAISGVLASLDNLITLHQRKHDRLVVLKKALLGRMFPRDGSRFPELRFDGFTDPWEQRKLGEVAEIVGGGTPDTNNPAYWDGDIDWYSPAELGEQIYADMSQRRITREGYENSSARMLPAGKTILFTSRAGIGTTAILRRSACTNQGFQSLVLRDEVNVYFVYSMSNRLKAYAESKASGSTFLEISGKQLAEMELMLPNRTEQDEIGGFFAQLDNLITLHQRKLELLRNLKSACLDKMFV